jgi:hypothetical protein
LACLQYTKDLGAPPVAALLRELVLSKIGWTASHIGRQTADRLGLEEH